MMMNNINTKITSNKMKECMQRNIVNESEEYANMTSNKMKEWMQKNIVNEPEEYVGIHKKINENESNDINEKKNENTVAYVSDIRVSIEGSYLR